MSILYFLVSVTVSFIVFLKVFDALNKSNLHLFVPFQKSTSKFKDKKRSSNITAVILVLLSFFIKDAFLLTDVVQGLILGVSLSLCSIIFDEDLIRSK